MIGPAIRRVAAAVAMAVLAAAPALAVQPNEMLDDPALEARAREISKDIRCLVCQNQSIDDSNADLARDLRILVRERIKAGDSNQAVKDYLVERYGAYVLLTPPMRLSTALLWGAPVLLVGLGGLGVAFWFRARRREAAGAASAPAETALSAEETKRLDALLHDSDGPGGDARS